MSTLAQIAKHIDLSSTSVSTLVKQGILPPSQPGRGIDLDAARISYIRHLRHRAGGKAISGDYNEERTRLVKAQADSEEIKLAELRGELLRGAMVADAWGDIVTTLRARLLALPVKLAAKAMSTHNLRDSEEFVRAEIYQALTELSDHANTGVGVEYLEPAETSTDTDSEPVG